MSLSADGYFDWAIQHPGHPEKVYPGRNANQGIVWHSAEGYLPSLLGLVQNFDRKASWTGSIAFDGRLYQHYSVLAKCWASGNAVANGQYWSFELEGTQGNPATPEQVETCLRIASEFEAFTGMAATRTGFPRTMFEHNEVAEIAAPNAGPTSCPSHRYDPFFAALDTEDTDMGMTPEEKALLISVAQAQVGYATGIAADGSHDVVKELTEKTAPLADNPLALRGGSAPPRVITISGPGLTATQED